MSGRGDGGAGDGAWPADAVAGGPPYVDWPASETEDQQEERRQRQLDEDWERKEGGGRARLDEDWERGSWRTRMSGGWPPARPALPLTLDRLHPADSETVPCWGRRRPSVRRDTAADSASGAAGVAAYAVSPPPLPGPVPMRQSMHSVSAPPS